MGDNVEFFVENPQAIGTPFKTGAFEDLGVVSVHGNGGADTLVVDFSGDNPLANGISFLDGAPATITIIGDSGNDSLSAGATAATFASSVFTGSVTFCDAWNDGSLGPRNRRHAMGSQRENCSTETRENVVFEVYGQKVRLVKKHTNPCITWALYQSGQQDGY